MSAPTDTSTRDIWDRASPRPPAAPTARELLNIAFQYKGSPPTELATRVEAVLTMPLLNVGEDQDPGYDACLAEVFALLNGRKP